MLGFARSVAVLALVGNAACSLDPYSCGRSDQCRRDGARGTCEVEGFCSYPDDACESGARYSPNAPPGLAGACVTSEAGTTSAGTSTSMSMSTSMSTSTSETSGVDETPGEQVWVRSWDGAIADGVAVGGETVAVVGTEAETPWIVAVTSAGDDVFGPLTFPEQTSTKGTGVAASETAIAMVGTGTAGAAAERAWIALLDHAGTVTDEQAFDTLDAEAFNAVAGKSAGFAAVGHQGERGWVRWLGASATDAFETNTDLTGAGTRSDGAVGIVGGGRWRIQLPGGTEVFAGDVPSESLTAIAFDADGSFAVVGLRASLAFVSAFGPSGAPLWSRDLGEANNIATGVALDDGDAIVAISGPPGGGVLTRVGADSEPRWSAPLEHNGTPVAPTGVAQSSTGDLFVSGAAGATAWLAQYRP